MTKNDWDCIVVGALVIMALVAVMVSTLAGFE